MGGILPTAGWREGEGDARSCPPGYPLLLHLEKEPADTAEPPSFSLLNPDTVGRGRFSASWSSPRPHAIPSEAADTRVPWRLLPAGHPSVLFPAPAQLFTEATGQRCSQLPSLSGVRLSFRLFDPGGRGLSNQWQILGRVFRILSLWTFQLDHWFFKSRSMDNMHQRWLDNVQFLGLSGFSTDLRGRWVGSVFLTGSPVDPSAHRGLSSFVPVPP